MKGIKSIYQRVTWSFFGPAQGQHVVYLVILWRSRKADERIDEADMRVNQPAAAGDHEKHRQHTNLSRAPKMRKEIRLRVRSFHLMMMAARVSVRT